MAMSFTPAQLERFRREAKKLRRQLCDYANPETANAVPETLVAFSDSKSKLTRAVSRTWTRSSVGHADRIHIDSSAKLDFKALEWKESQTDDEQAAVSKVFARSATTCEPAA